MKLNNRGFTLVELMITLAMTGIIIAAVYSANSVQQRANSRQEQVLEVQQSLRAALYAINQEIRMAGYDPEGSSKAGFTAATATALTFTMDSNANKTIDAGTDETITYTLNSTTLQRNGQPLIDNVEKLEFYYTMEDETQTTAPSPSKLEDIRSVTISLLARSKDPGGKFVDNKTYKSASGASWTAAKKNHRRQLFTSTIQCRNIGI